MARRIQRMADVELNGKCGHLKKDGERCKQQAGAGTDHLGFGVCSHHGGNSGAFIIHAERQRIAHMSMQLGEPIVIEPHQALLEEVYRCAGHVKWLHDKILELGDDDLIEASMAGKHPTIWIRWYQDERQRLVQAAATAIKAGVEERKVQATEEQGRILAGVIRVLLNRLGLSPEQERAAPALLRQALTELPVPDLEVLEVG